ncbi:MAG: amino acid synthesis family protein [Rhodospirillaceae bacterium]|nr:peptide synthetase [Rhodospirillaceae bacterium]RPG01552.1 MAG: amino acid synthesis family protein [Rhodospirillaceae bacterium TMED63]RZO38667.1 MAG: amino acid synthesis family protein [Rhodospirillaceae bacterium]
MPGTEIRKIVTLVEETRIEIGEVVDPPSRQCAAVAVIKNPYAGRFSHDLPELEAAGAELGDLLGRCAMNALGISAAEVHSFGKAAIIGENGEKEHGAACMHPTMGKPLRDIVGPAPSIIPSAKKVGGPGTAIDCPLHHKEDVWTFSHFDAMEVALADAPRADEIVVIIALTDSGRPLHRVGEGKGAGDVGAD